MVSYPFSSSGNTLSSSVASRVGKSLLVKKAAGRSSTMSKKNAREGVGENLTPSDQSSVPGFTPGSHNLYGKSANSIID